MAGTAAGSQLITADGVVGVSGASKIVYGVHIISGATAGVVNLRRGTAVGDAIGITHTGTISLGVTFPYPQEGFHFPGGCFVDVDANVTSVLVSYREL